MTTYWDMLSKPAKAVAEMADIISLVQGVNEAKARLKKTLRHIHSEGFIGIDLLREAERAVDGPDDAKLEQVKAALMEVVEQEAADVKNARGAPGEGGR